MIRLLFLFVALGELLCACLRQILHDRRFPVSTNAFGHCAVLGLLLCSLGVGGVSSALAQQSISDSTILCTTIDITYSGYFPLQDFAQRYGFSSQLGAMVGVKFRSNWYAKAGGMFLFGEQLRENDIFSGVGYSNVWRRYDGEVLVNSGWINRNGETFEPSASLRGFTVPVRFGRIFNGIHLWKSNPNTGLFIETGAQFIHHQLLISAPKEAPYLKDDYAKGYDRLTQGFGLLGSLGYQYWSNSRFLNFYLAADLQYNRTRTLRFNFDTRQRDDRIRNDHLIGFRFGWVFLIYEQNPEKFYYY
jgi:hypothetical protein